ncbi:DUF4291 family protein [Pseudobacteroides cellulosolvens]|nr:DUF4291 family protein [Pseudobacteroides cellulosolvens]
MNKNEKIINSKLILAQYNERTIKIYQAYNNQIADEAIKLGTFGYLL